MGAVGLIVNPVSGKDIRRLVASGSVSTNEDKINILTRLFQGMETAKVTDRIKATSATRSTIW